MSDPVHYSASMAFRCPTEVAEQIKQTAAASMIKPGELLRQIVIAHFKQQPAKSSGVHQ